MANYAAFLRGINVGGHKPVPMEKLKKAFESMRFKNVRTLLASGNIVFEAPLQNSTKLEQMIGEKLKNTFETDIPVIIRTMEELQHLSESQPFKDIAITLSTRLYVTFLTEEPKSSLKIPYVSPDSYYRILHVTGREVCCVLSLSPNGRTVDLMKLLEKEFGRNITTRNWNTIVRILKLHEQT
jgi:uncharacterized protein (DUF1697 family)